MIPHARGIEKKGALMKKAVLLIFLIMAMCYGTTFYQEVVSVKEQFNDSQSSDGQEPRGYLFRQKAMEDIKIGMSKEEVSGLLKAMPEVQIMEVNGKEVEVLKCITGGLDGQYNSPEERNKNKTPGQYEPAPFLIFEPFFFENDRLIGWGNKFKGNLAEEMGKESAAGTTKEP